MQTTSKYIWPDKKLGSFIVIKCFKNWGFQKMSVIKNVLLNWYSSIKKNYKDLDNFHVENWLWKSEFCKLLSSKKFVSEKYLSGFYSFKIHIFLEGHKTFQNLLQSFVLFTASQIIRGDFAKFCGLLRTYKLYIYPYLSIVLEIIMIRHNLGHSCHGYFSYGS
jgi:hypothetical protein